MRRLLHPLAIGMLVGLALFALAGAVRVWPDFWRPVDSLERHLLDLHFRLRGPRPAGPEVALVAFDDRTWRDDQSLQEKRSGIARVIRAVHAAGAKVIGFDGFFFDPEQPIDPALAKEVLSFLERCHGECEADEAAKLLARLRPELLGDEDLAAALREADPVVLALASQAARLSQPQSLARGRFGQSVAGRSPPRAVDQVSASLPAFNAAARALGFVTAVEDDTRTVREIAAGRAVKDAAYAPFAVQLAAAYLEVPRARLVFDGDGRMVRLGDRSVPFEPDGSFLLNFRGPKESFPTWSAIDVVNGEVPGGALKGRIAIVGFTYLGHDHVRTPFSTIAPGFEVNATLVDNILHGDPLRRAPWLWEAWASLLIALAIGLFFWPRLLPGAVFQVSLSLLVWAGYLCGSHWAFSSGNLWVAGVAPSVAALLSLAGCVVVSYAREGRQRRELRRAFSHYLAEEVIHELEERDEPLHLGGERRTLTALFSDIRGFTTLSERLDPMQLVAFLNTHLSAMTRAVLAQGGILDKYIGDALMAFFGAPVPHADHVDRALSAALAMHQELLHLNQGPFKEMNLTVRIGVGLNTGEMVVGNMGSDKHYNYTVAGDAVNLASRLESLTKVYGVFCLVGESTRRAAGARFGFREVDLVQVKGRTEAVAIHELLSGPSGTLVAYQGLERFAQGMAAWRAGELARARPLFEDFAKDNPDDKVAPLYLERLRALGDKVPEGWNGVFVHTAK